MDYKNNKIVINKMNNKLNNNNMNHNMMNDASNKMMVNDNEMDNDMDGLDYQENDMYNY